jgi:hypothetical protein
MASIVKEDESLDPVDVALFRFGTVVPRFNRLPHLIDKFGSWLSCRRIPQGALFESISVQGIYIGGFYVVPSCTQSVCERILPILNMISVVNRCPMTPLHADVAHDKWVLISIPMPDNDS